MIDTAVVLAGGLGTRLRSVVPDLPKPMASVNGRPFLASLMEYWILQDIKKFILSVGYKHQEIIDYFGFSFNGSRIDYVVENTPLGTGGGLLLAKQRLDSNSPFLLLNGDTYFEVDAKRLCSFAQQVDADWCISLFKTYETSRYLGLDVGEKGEILNLRPSTKMGECFANGGVYWVNPQSLDALNFPLGNHISLENEIFPSLTSQGQKVFGLAFNSNFIDIGIPDDYQRASKLIAY